MEHQITGIKKQWKKVRCKMCVPESALRYYEDELEKEYEAQLNGYDSYEDYYNSMQDDIENRAYDNWKDERAMDEL